MKRILSSIAAAAAIAAVATPASAATELDSLVGMRGSSLDNEMGNRGYELARSQGAQYWWNAGTGQCAAISISNGRVSRIRAASTADCGKAVAPPRAFDCNAPDLSEADRYRCPAGGGTGGGSDAAGRSAAIKTCTDTFGPNSKLGTVSALKPGFWEVILSDNYGRKVSCTGRSGGGVEQWDEIGRK